VLDPYQINLRHLNAVRAIGEHGGISRAAEAAFLSQPALTQALAKLERTLEVALFERHASGMTATPAGELLVARANRAFEHLAEGSRLLKPAAGQRQGAPIHRYVSMAQLRAIVAIVVHGGFAPAARATGLSEPAMYRSARELERLAGLPLLVRRGRGVEPSPAAERFVQRARLAVAEIATMLAEIATLRGEGGGRVVVGAMSLARVRLVPRAVTRTHEALPHVSFSIIDGPYHELLGKLRAGDIDLLVGALRDPPPADDVVEEQLFVDHAVIAARIGHPLTSETSPDLAALKGYPWIIAREGAPLRRAWEDLFAEHGASPPPVTVECGSMMAINALLGDGEWLTLVLPELIRREREAGRLTVIGPPLARARLPIGVTTRRGWLPSTAQGYFLDVLRGFAPDTYGN
jgi:DNA-binding transcriptional LysR family regulator